MSEIAIHKATLDDSRDIWAWRNDEVTRAMSLSTDEVSWQSHSTWFEKSLLNHKRHFYVGRLVSTDQKVGMCRFDMNDVGNEAEVSINLNPSMRGLSLSHQLLSAAMKFFLGEHPVQLVATIKKENPASIKCFTKCGFVFSHDDQERNFYTYTPSL